MVLKMAQNGQVQSQITDSYMRQMLEGISGAVRQVAAARSPTQPRHPPPPPPPARAPRKGVCPTRRGIACACRHAAQEEDKKKGGIAFDRRRFADDDDSDVDLDGL